MRAIFHSFSKLIIGDTFNIEGERAHHLQVVRVRSNEILKVLNGQGQILLAQVRSIAKNNVELVVSQIEYAERSHNISLAIALPKKEAFEDILKMAVELGISVIHPLKSDYSQYDFSPSERIERIVESALVQSNNPFLPQIKTQTSLGQFLKEHTDPIVFFNSQISDKQSLVKFKNQTLLIGPEGGFSAQEIDEIRSRNALIEIHLPTPILRAPTAVASSVGYILGLDLK